jgi:hypothetical protein
MIAVSTLVATVKTHLEKAAASAEKAEQHYISAGLRLKELKERKPGNVPWPEYVRKTFDLGRSRADELIQIADGRTTVAETREAIAKRVQKHSNKPPLANGGSQLAVTTTHVTSSVNERVGELGEFLSVGVCFEREAATVNW